MKPRFDWRHQYDNDRDKKEGDLAALDCKDDSLTHQNFAADADLNVIAKRFGITNITELPAPPMDPRLYRDTTNDPDLRDILEHRNAAKEAFANLPPKIRKRFRSQQELLEFMADDDNRDEAIKLGLIERKPEPIPKEPKAAPPETPPQKETPSQKVSPST